MQKEELEQKHLHLLQIVESEKTAKWQYTQQCEELTSEIKKLRTEVNNFFNIQFVRFNQSETPPPPKLYRQMVFSKCKSILIISVPEEMLFLQDFLNLCCLTLIIFEKLNNKLLKIFLSKPHRSIMKINKIINCWY